MPGLLGLPRELRDEIYRLVLGTHMVHLTSDSWTVTRDKLGADPSSGENETVYSDSLCCERCVETNTEQEAYEISQDLDQNDPYGIMPGVSKGRCRYCRRHGQCTRSWFTVPWRVSTKHGPVVSLHPPIYTCMALLRVSSTVYQDASAILYANTTFSFKLAHTLATFAQTLTPLQRPEVKSVHLDINLDYENASWSWKSDDLQGTLASLSGLRNLNLTIRQSCQGDLRAVLESLQEDSLPLWKNDLVHFRRCSLRSVSVVVEDTDSSSIQEWNGRGLWQRRFDYLEQEGNWKMAERARYARILRDKLLAISSVSSKDTCDQACV